MRFPYAFPARTKFIMTFSYTECPAIREILHIGKHRSYVSVHFRRNHCSPVAFLCSSSVSILERFNYFSFSSSCTCFDPFFHPPGKYRTGCVEKFCGAGTKFAIKFPNYENHFWDRCSNRGRITEQSEQRNNETKAKRGKFPLVCSFSSSRVYHKLQVGVVLSRDRFFNDCIPKHR